MVYSEKSKKLCAELYHNLCDIVYSTDVVDPSNAGQGFIVPSSFVGSARYMQQNFQDSLVVCRKIGYPDLFLTMMCNPYWDEIFAYDVATSCLQSRRLSRYYCKSFQVKVRSMV